MDEYQIQVPKKFVKLIPINLDGIERKLNKKGNLESDAELATRLAKDISYNGKLMGGKPMCVNGVWNAVYSPVGELMVKCVEKAAKLMMLPVNITGEYLTGRNWAECH